MCSHTRSHSGLRREDALREDSLREDAPIEDASPAHVTSEDTVREHSMCQHSMNEALVRKGSAPENSIPWTTHSGACKHTPYKIDRTACHAGRRAHVACGDHVGRNAGEGVMRVRKS